MTKTFKNLLISCFVLLLIIIFVMTGMLLAGTENAYAAADTVCYINVNGGTEDFNRAITVDSADLFEYNNEVITGVHNGSKNISGIAGFNNAIGTAGAYTSTETIGNDAALTGTLERSRNSVEPASPFQPWMYSLVIPFFLLLLLIFAKTKQGNLKRKTLIAMVRERLQYYGLSKKDNSVFKDKVSSFSAREIRERIRQNRENRREERRILQNRSNYNF